MSFRIGGGDRDDGDEELFRAAHAVSGGEDHFPEAGGVGDHHGSHRMFVPQPLRRMNSDSIYDCTSSMTAQLPAKKKGLSRYYGGRSQSFACCMSEVQSLEDLQKENPYKHKVKACKSYAALRGMANKAKASSNSCANLNIVAADGFRATPIHANKSRC